MLIFFWEEEPVRKKPELSMPREAGRIQEWLRESSKYAQSSTIAPDLKKHAKPSDTQQSQSNGGGVRSCPEPSCPPTALGSEQSERDIGLESLLFHTNIAINAVLDSCSRLNPFQAQHHDSRPANSNQPTTAMLFAQYAKSKKSIKSITHAKTSDATSRLSAASTRAGDLSDIGGHRSRRGTTPATSR